MKRILAVGVSSRAVTALSAARPTLELTAPDARQRLKATDPPCGLALGGAEADARQFAAEAR